MKLGLIFNKKNKEEIYNDILAIFQIIQNFNVELLIADASVSLIGITYCKDYDELIKNSDVVVAVGGDGTIIKTAKLCAKYDKPVLGINKGNLGFLASLEKDEIYKITDLFNNKLKIKKSSILECFIDNHSFLALNDIVITRDTESRIVNYRIYKENKANICKYNADGIIISTSTGSTAYFISAGGPIIDPELNCLAIAPICPHTLYARSHVVGINDPVIVEYSLKENSKICIFVDGNLCFKSLKNNKITIKHSKLEAKFIVFSDRNFYEEVEKKLIRGVLL